METVLGPGPTSVCAGTERARPFEQRPEHGAFDMRMIWLKLVFRSRKWALGQGVVAVSLVLSRFASAQGAGGPPSAPEPTPVAPAPTPAAPPDAPRPPDTPASTPPIAAPPAVPTPPPGAPAAAPPKPSPFTFALHGFVSGSMYMQDTAVASGQGNGAIFGPADLSTDKWLLGGDVRQTQLKFTVAGPEVLGGATPNAIVEVDFLGGHQVSS